MIELRWLQEKGDLEPLGRWIEKGERVLQMRQAKFQFNEIGGGQHEPEWSEWQDIPVVEEE